MNDIGRLKRDGRRSDPRGTAGSTSIQSLTRAGLIDEYRLVIHPAVIGHGTGLFQLAGRLPLRLVLVEAHTYPSGTAIHVYRTWPQAA